MMTRTTASLFPLALLLAACGGGEDAPEAEATEDAGPQGEVRGGTISDAMLPVGTLRSQSPQRGGDDDTSENDAVDEGDAEGGDAE
tara:strand:+ start:2252 stop:2509 length:258 start_codon:yes stop_codon:yes gene_type:complete